MSRVFVVLAFFGMLAGFAAQLHAAPRDSRKFAPIADQFADIPNGALMEGSVGFGGTQPDYVVDMSSPALQKLWKDCQQIRVSGMGKWEKVATVVRMIRAALPHGDYDSAPYLKLIDGHRAAGTDVEIGEYVACRAGVCRENAILTHLALKEAGVPNKHVYVKTEIIYEGQTKGKIENHGFVVIQDGGKRWVADSYWAQFNGYDFDELLRPNAPATHKFRNRLPFALKRNDLRRVVEVNRYPIIWKPRVAKESTCPAWYAGIKYYKSP